ncbi:Lipopolysaccharide assembly protein B [Halomonadaceae bacterium LMG 33818]|uniref:hypothetical protein n=1 Tax=Cernens ardua TaxID=3402176 RepID=UPI003EDBD293
MKFRRLSSLLVALPLSAGVLSSGITSLAYADTNAKTATSPYSNDLSRVENLGPQTVTSLLQAQALLASGQNAAAAIRYLSAAKQSGSLLLLNQAAEALGSANAPRVSQAIALEWLKSHPAINLEKHPPSPAMATVLMNHFAYQQQWNQALDIGLWLDEQGQTPELARLISQALDANANLTPLAQQLSHYTKQHPNRFQPTLASAIVTMGENHPQTALTNIHKIEEKWPKEAATWLVESQIQLALQQPEKALIAIQHAHELAPDQPRYIFAIVQLQLDLKQNDNAFKSAQELLASTNNPPSLRIQLGQLFLEAQQPALAEQLLTPNLKSSNVPAGVIARTHLLMGAAAEQRQQWKTAVSSYTSIPQNSSDFMPSRIRATELLVAHQSEQAAVSYLADQRAHYPNQRGPLTVLSISLLDDLQESAQATQLLDQQIQAMAPHNDNLLMLRAQRNIQQKRPAAVERDLKILLSRHPNSAEVLNTYGYTLTLFTHRYPEALSMLTKANQVAPNNAAIMDSLAWTYAKMNQPHQALHWELLAYKQDQEDEIASHLISILLMLGQKQEAQKVATRGMTQLASHPELSQLIQQNPWLVSAQSSSSLAKGAVTR